MFQCATTPVPMCFIRLRAVETLKKMDGCLTCDQWRSRPEYVLTETISVALWKHFGEQLQKVASRELPIGTLRPEMVALGFLCWLSPWEVTWRNETRREQFSHQIWFFWGKTQGPSSWGFSLWLCRSCRLVQAQAEGLALAMVQVQAHPLGRWLHGY